MKRLLGLVALVGFILSLAVHLASLRGIDPSAQYPAVGLLHIGVFVVFVPFVFASRRALGPKTSLETLQAGLPDWTIALGYCLFLYAIANFVLFLLGTEGGSPSILNGNYVLLNHGKLIRELSASEYQAFRANLWRGFSGHWLLFYYIPWVYFFFYKKPKSGSPMPDSHDRPSE